MRIIGLRFALLGLGALITGCEREEEIKVYRVVKEGGGGEPASLPADPHAGLSLDGPPGGALPPGHPPTRATGAINDNELTGNVPDDWEAGRASSMRRASYAAKGTAGEMADISLVILAGDAGGTLENVNRWRGQLGQKPLDEAGLEQATERLGTEVGEAVVVDIEGAGEDADPLTDGRIVAAIVEQKGETWFFKMRGNAELVAAHKQGFLDWVASVKPETDKGVEEVAEDPAAAPPGVAAGNERDGVRWKVPAGWSEGPAKPMRVVTYVIAGEGDDGAEVTVVKLSGDGGGTLANVNRWRRQIGMDPVGAEALAEIVMPARAGELDLSVIDQSGPEGRTVAAWAKRTGESWFFKLTGPPAVVEAERKAFVTFLESVSFTEE